MSGFNFVEFEPKRTMQVSGRLVLLLWILVAGLAFHNISLNQIQSAQQKVLNRAKSRIKSKDLRAVQVHRPHWRHLLLLLSRTLPQKAYLTKLRLKPYQIRIWGVAQTKKMVRQFLNRLKKQPQVNMVQLSGLENFKNAVRFTMQLKVNHEN
ncbi:MAG: hypothetical protein CENE_01057 [Candidatus Celerinatantimonas neptuna]|nr:MAG: hypothetical protein CENE_01057 [Candidatus Celerinatantimonas neptuna]